MNQSDLARLTREESEEQLDRIVALADGPRFTPEQVAKILVPLGAEYVSQYGGKRRLQASDIDDATQEFFLRLVGCLRPVDDGSDLQVLTWGSEPARSTCGVLRTLAQYSVREELRRNGRRRHANVDEAGVLEDPASSFVDELERQDVLDLLADLAEDKLSERALELWRLYYVDQLGVARIAEVCGVSPQRVRESNSRSNKVLRQELLPV